MASGFHLAFFLCLTGGLLISGAMSAPAENEKPGPCCPPGWSQFGSRCFIYHHSGKTWTDAEQLCISDGGNLASVHSEDEYSFLRKLIFTATGGHHVTWIGGYDAVKEGTWQWSDGSKFDYTRWYTGEPNNHGGKEHCIEMNYGERWNDRPCQTHRFYICAKDTSQ